MNSTSTLISVCPKICPETPSICDMGPCNTPDRGTWPAARGDRKASGNNRSVPLAHTRKSRSPEVTKWLERVEPDSFEDPELLSPFPELPTHYTLPTRPSSSVAAFPSSEAVQGTPVLLPEPDITVPQPAKVTMASPEQAKEKLPSNTSRALQHKKEKIGERGRQPHRYDFDFQFGDSDAEETPARQRDENRHKRHASQVTTFSTFIRAAAGSSYASPTKSRSLSPDKLKKARDSSKHRPEPLDLSDARRYGELVKQKKGTEAVHMPIKSAKGQIRQIQHDGSSSSVYSMTNIPADGAPSAMVSPLHVKKEKNILKAYRHWKDANTPPLPAEFGQPGPAVPPRSTSATTRLEQDVGQDLPNRPWRPSGTTSEAQGPQGNRIQKSATEGNIKKSATEGNIKEEPESAPFTPLTPWIVGHNRKTSKTLFGEHGWLHDTAVGDKKQPENRKSKPASFFDGIKKLTRDLVEKAEMTTQAKPREREVKRITISLDPREQSLLYCELEFILSNALDQYIKAQLNGGRLDPDKLKRVADAWAAQGRPRVVGFRFDLETQLELVRAHLHQFRFYGAAQAQAGRVVGLLGAMRADARALRVRTFCQPDAVVAKHVVDAQAFLVMIGSAEGLQLALAEVAQFFRVIVEREKAVQARRDASRRGSSFVRRDDQGHLGGGGGFGFGGQLQPQLQQQQAQAQAQAQDPSGYESKQPQSQIVREESQGALQMDDYDTETKRWTRPTEI